MGASLLVANFFSLAAFKILSLALTSVAQLVGCSPAKLKVARSIPGRGTCLGCRFSPGQGAQERQPISVVVVPLLLTPPIIIIHLFYLIIQY